MQQIITVATLEERGEGRKKKKLLPADVRHSDGRSTYVGTGHPGQ